MTHAAECRKLIAEARHATLSTIARDPDGYPYGSLVAIASDDRGRPVLLLSRLAEHTENLRARPEASVLVAAGAGLDPLAEGRVTLLGACSIVPDDERAAVKAIFLAHQPSAATYVDFADFGFYRLEPKALRFVGGFGRMSWVDPGDYRDYRGAT